VAPGWHVWENVTFPPAPSGPIRGARLSRSATDRPEARPLGDTSMGYETSALE
jgi:hypothetical protein